MILSASVNADIPAHYGAWFRRRLEAGYLRVAGADPWKQRRIELDPKHVDGIVFWTRDIAPFWPVLDALKHRGMPFIVQYAVTAAERAQSCAAIAAMRELVARFGPRIVVWRCDPLRLDEHHEPQTHAQAFGTLAASLAGISDEAIIAFARPRAAHRSRVESRVKNRTAEFSAPDSTSAAGSSERRDLVRRLAEIARGYGMRLSVCADADALAPGASPARCIDARRLADIAGRSLDVPTAGFMRDCLCARAVDIGDHGGTEPECFCGADAKRKLRLHHDPQSEFLFEPARRFRPARAADLPF